MSPATNEILSHHPQVLALKRENRLLQVVKKSLMKTQTKTTPPSKKRRTEEATNFGNEKVLVLNKKSKVLAKVGCEFSF
jgi:hypothetical protein